MRVVLIHNPASGSGSSRKELERLLRGVGCEVVYCSTEGKDFADALEDPADLVLIAGGDGTVTKVTRRLAGRSIPLAIIPLGTSNNIASALGLHGTAEELICGLPSAERRKLDVGTARAPWGIRRFIESAGVGIFAVMLEDDARGIPESGGSAGREKIDQGLRRLRRVLAKAPARESRIDADGVDLSGRYLLALALNIGRVGPRIWFAPQADPGDGRLDLVLVREDDRESLDTYLEEQILGRPTAFPIEARRASRIRLTWAPDAGHLDDDAWPEDPALAPGAGTAPMVTLEICDPPLEVLVSPWGPG